VGRRLTFGKLNSREELRTEIKRLYEKGINGGEISISVGVSQATVSRIINGDNPQPRYYKGRKYFKQRRVPPFQRTEDEENPQMELDFLSETGT
jgi:IS30 family transposase